MTKNHIYTSVYECTEVIPDIKEILRYMGQPDTCNEEVKNFAITVNAEMYQVFVPRISFTVKDISVSDNRVQIENYNIPSSNLAKNLKNCNSAIVFVLTLGAGVDRAITRYGTVSPLHALTADAIATAATEKTANKLCGELKQEFFKENLFLRPRFSPGYGDFELMHQHIIFEMTDAVRRCGVTLTDELICIPSKSVTGIIGISSVDSGCTPDGCEVCKQKNCIYSRR